ncbi:MAG: copper chaperone PCu(A)C [Halofilum sp. (in: g-proteobacteria)]|nr:copper chaperone PCu(A)C [Halofilum sp. (in: g-proteobacteria)]
MGAAYLVIVNTGDAPDRLVAASTPVAARTQLHRSVEVDGESRMVHQAEGVPVPAGATVRFAPHGYHVMLMGLERRLEAGDRVPLMLRFERAGRIELEVPVRALDWLPDD